MASQYMNICRPVEEFCICKTTVDISYKFILVIKSTSIVLLDILHPMVQTRYPFKGDRIKSCANLTWIIAKVNIWKHGFAITLCLGLPYVVIKFSVKTCSFGAHLHAASTPPATTLHVCANNMRFHMHQVVSVISAYST